MANSFSLPALLLLTALLGAGCRPSPAPPQFSLNLEGRAPQSLGPRQAEAITHCLAELFGTPDEPKVPPGVDLKPELLALAAGSPDDTHQQQQPDSIAANSTRGLYRKNCAVCHGLSGDGAGPDARACVPNYPRDFRDGLFKFTSTRGGAKPTSDDLRRTLLRGLRGTSMPAWISLQAEELDALIEYVRYLSIRGQTEQYLLQLVVDEDQPLPLAVDQVLEEAVLPAARSWHGPRQRRAEWVVVPPPRPPIVVPAELAASIAQGRTLYLTNQAQCVKCHGPKGDGKGEQAEVYDDWNKRKLGATPQQTAQLAPLFTLPLRSLTPRDFHQDIFHGGSDPADLHLRIAVGIKGTPMPGAAASPGAKAVLQPEEIWHVVNFIRSLGDGKRDGVTR